MTSQHDIAKKSIFIHTKVHEDIMTFFRTYGKKYSFKKGGSLSNTMLENNVILLNRGLISNTQYLSFAAKGKLSVLVLPQRLVDPQLILINEFTACKSAEVLRDSEILAVGFEEIQNLITENTALHRLMLAECAFEYRRYMHLPIYLLSADPEKKAVRFFYDILMAFRVDLSYRWIKIPIKLSRQEICDALYISLITYDKIINKWHKNNLVKRDQNHLVVNGALFENISKCAMESDRCSICNIYKKYF